MALPLPMQSERWLDDLSYLLGDKDRSDKLLARQLRCQVE